MVDGRIVMVNKSIKKLLRSYSILWTPYVYSWKPVKQQFKKFFISGSLIFFSLISRYNHKSNTKSSGFVWKLSRQYVGVHKIQGSNEIFRTSLIKSKHWYQPHVATLYSVLNPFDTLIQNKINTGKVCWNIFICSW